MELKGATKFPHSKGGLFRASVNHTKRIDLVWRGSSSVPPAPLFRGQQPLLRKLNCNCVPRNLKIAMREVFKKNYRMDIPTSTILSACPVHKSLTINIVSVAQPGHTGQNSPGKKKKTVNCSICSTKQITCWLGDLHEALPDLHIIDPLAFIVEALGPSGLSSLLLTSKQMNVLGELALVCLSFQPGPG